MPDSASLATQPAEPSLQDQSLGLSDTVAADRLALASLVAAAAMAAAAACTETADPAMCRYTAASGQLL